MWTIFFLSIAVPSQVAGPQDPPPPGMRIRTEVNVYIDEEFDEERDHEEYEQEYPVEHSTRTEGAEGAVSGRVTYFTRCRFRQEDRVPAPPPLLPGPRLTLTGFFSSRIVEVPAEAVPHLVTGNPRVDPEITKPHLAGGGGSGGDSDRPFLYGTDIDLILARDVAAWEHARWLPESTSLHLYGRAMHGRFEVFDVDSSLELYSAGARLAFPLFHRTPLSLAAAVSAGPAIMKTDIGDAWGWEAGAGLRGEVFITGGVSLLAAVDVSLFLSDDFLSWGPGANAGLNIGW